MGEKKLLFKKESSEKERRSRDQVWRAYLKEKNLSLLHSEALLTEELLIRGNLTYAPSSREQRNR